MCSIASSMWRIKDLTWLRCVHNIHAYIHVYMGIDAYMHARWHTVQVLLLLCGAPVPRLRGDADEEKRHKTQIYCVERFKCRHKYVHICIHVAQVGLKWPQVGPMFAPLWPKMAPSWTQVGSSTGLLGRSCLHREWKCKNINIIQIFIAFCKYECPR